MTARRNLPPDPRNQMRVLSASFEHIASQRSASRHGWPRRTDSVIGFGMASERGQTDLPCLPVRPARHAGPRHRSARCSSAACPAALSRACRSSPSSRSPARSTPAIRAGAAHAAVHDDRPSPGRSAALGRRTHRRPGRGGPAGPDRSRGRRLHAPRRSRGVAGAGAAFRSGCSRVGPGRLRLCPAGGTNRSGGRPRPELACCRSSAS